MREIYIRKTDGLDIAVVEDGRLVEYFPAEDESSSEAIILGKVERIMPGMKAAFVQIGQEKCGFLPLEERNCPDLPKLQTGMSVLVQVRKEAQGVKGAFLSRDINLCGEFVLFSPMNRMTAVSSRITKEKHRKALKDLAKDIAGGEFGLIMRSASHKADEVLIREEVEALRIKYLSKKGEISALMADFRNVPADMKKELGMKLNELKNAALDKINALKSSAATEEAAGSHVDLTRTPYPIALGTRHPLTIVKNEIVDIFSRLGFTLAEGPEVEDDWHVYSSMNFADDHPARDMQDTFFVESHPDIILRSHTSSVQARVMEKAQPPIRIICPGRVYRNEAISARAHCFFHQVEGLYIDKNVSFKDLKQVLLLFAQEMFGADTKIRLRPSYFPFTEPSAEMDISCNICGGEGCSFCKHTGWVEILGCGMVDPAVLEANGIDSSIYTGYAFGMGIERITNLKYQVKDLRMFSENDVRFLDEFQSAN